MNKNSFIKYYEADADIEISMRNTPRQTRSIKEVTSEIDNSRFVGYYILKTPFDSVSHCHVFSLLSMDDDVYTLYCGCTEEDHQLFLNEYLEYIYEYTIGETDKPRDWYKTDTDWVFLEISNTGKNNYHSLWYKTREWLAHNIPDARQNVQWSRSGDCQYYKFRNKDDAMRFKLIWS